MLFYIDPSPEVDKLTPYVSNGQWSMQVHELMKPQQEHSPYADL